MKRNEIKRDDEERGMAYAAGELTMPFLRGRKKDAECSVRKAKFSTDAVADIATERKLLWKREEELVILGEKRRMRRFILFAGGCVCQKESR